MTDEQTPNVAEILLNNIETKQEEWSEAGSRLNSLLATIDVYGGDDLYAALNDFREGQVSEEALRELAQRYTQDSELVDCYLKQLSLDKELEELKIEHKPFKLAELQTQVDSISSRINYDAIIEYYDEPNRSVKKTRDKWDSGEMANATATIAILRQASVKLRSGEIESKTWDELERIEKAIQRNSEEWEKRGFLHELPQNAHDESIEDTKKRRLELKDQLQKGLEVMKEYGELKSNYRSMARNYAFRDEFFSKVSASLDLETGFDYAKDTWLANEYDPRYLDAVQTFVAKRKQQYVNDDTLPLTGESYVTHMTQLKAMEAQEMVGQITLVGFEPRDGEILVVNEQKLKDRLALFVPACFLDKIEIVTSKDKPKDINLNDPNIETVGSHVPEVDETGKLLKSKIEIYRSPRASESATQKEREIIEANFVETTLHEVAHSIHHDMSYGDLKAWHTVATQDRTAVTWYVRHTHLTRGEQRGNREDFAESFQMALLNPGTLLEISPARFEYMMKLVGMYMGNTQYEAFTQDIDAKLKKREEENAQRIRAFAETIAEEANKR